MEISGVLEKQREYFYGNNTKPYENRLSALKSLKDSMLRHEEEILNALRDDLNKSKYEGYMTELGLCIQEVSYAIKHIKKWMKPVKKSVQSVRDIRAIWDSPYHVAVELSFLLEHITVDWSSCCRQLRSDKTFGDGIKRCGYS